MKKKILIIYIILLVVGSITTGVFSISLIRTNNIRSKEEKLISNANMIIETLTVIDNHAREEGMHRRNNYFLLSQRFARGIGARVTFLKQTGEVLADSANNSIVFTSQVDRPEIAMAARGEVQGIQVRSDISDEILFYLAMPFVDIEGNPMIVRLSTTTEDIRNFDRLFLRYISISIMVGIIAAFFVGYWNINSIIKPIKEFTIASKSIAQGDFNKRVIVSTKDEIEELANHFNEMAIKLEGMIGEIKDKNAKLDAILKNIANGIIVIDKNRNLILCNHGAKEMFTVSHVVGVGSHLSEIINNSEVDTIIETTMETKEPHEGEVIFGKGKQKKILKMSTSFVELEENGEDFIGIILFVQDITKISKLEKLRSDFVANVSHELRTPITSISGFVEMLRMWPDMEEKDRDKVLNIIEFETERLKKLINDILSLSEIESMRTINYREKVDVESIIYETVDLIKPLAKEKGIGIEVNLDKGLRKVLGNNDLMKQAILNLLDNAVKYTSQGGNVIIQGKSTGNETVIAFKDNGMGIPEEDLARIFERFFRVDKARSRALGGTGLGLAIVKHIIKEFGGEITVSSQLGMGSEFTITLPAV